MSHTVISAAIILDHSVTPLRRHNTLLLPCWETGMDGDKVRVTVSNGGSSTRYVTISTETAQALGIVDEKHRTDIRFLYEELPEPRGGGAIWFAITGILGPDLTVYECNDMMAGMLSAPAN